MEIQLLTQPILNDGNAFSLGETITSILSSKKPKYKTANFIFGVLKQNAIDHLKPYLSEFIQNKGTINFYVDSDKRATAKNIINDLIDLGCNVFVFNSGDSLTEFQYRGCFFESSKKVDVFLTSGNLSMNGLFDSFNIVTHLTYNITSKEENEFTDFKNSILNESFLSKFSQVTSSDNFYDEENWSSIKASNLSIPSISEFTNKADTKQKEKNDTFDDSGILIEIDDAVDFLTPDETPKAIKEPKKAEENPIIPETPAAKLDTSSVIEYPTETIYYNTDNALDVESFLFEAKNHKVTPKPAIKSPEIPDTLDTPTENVTNKKITKAADLSKTAIFMFEASKITKRGVCAGEIKIPVYLRDLIANFWDWPTKYSVTGHAKIKSRICTFNIIDTSTSSTRIKDENVKLFQREDESSFSIHSKELEKLDINEKDIIRLIKTQDVKDTYYTCEIVRADSKEYAIWEQFCTSEMKNSKRKYGIM